MTGSVRLVDIENEMRVAYLDYAMSVIVARALPDARDGLKPVQRRILYAMHDMGLRSNAPYKKSARIVGEVLGKYHPHGDAAVYDAMARMAQDFSMRYMLVDGQGNFGSIDGDAPAAMRYTEARLSPVAEELLLDIDKDTVDWTDNFDGTLKEPTVLPARLPNLLLNGASGIAVGMATNLPPHNLGEVVDATCHLIDRWDESEEVTLEDLMAFVQGPDFPTGAHILGREGIVNAYAMGKGRVVMRAVTRIEEIKGGRYRIVVTELPYQVNKVALIERIADLVRDGRLADISDLRDESDRAGISLVIELKRGAQPRTVLNQLLKFTSLQSAFSVQMLALVNGQPRLLTLKRALQIFVEHRQEVIKRRSKFELNKALARAHILMGLYVALDFMDEVITLIRQSPDAETAKQRLMKRLRLSPRETSKLMQRLAFDHAQLVALMAPLKLSTREEKALDAFAQANLGADKQFELSEIQAQAILDMQLRRLAALERQKVADEYQDVLAQTIYLKYLLAHPHKILGLIKGDLLAMKHTYGDARRTHILADATEEFSETDLVPDQDVIVSITQRGYIKRVPAKAYRRSGKGVTAMQTVEEDAVIYIFAARTLNYVLFFSDKGKAYVVRAYDIPDADRSAKGVPLINLIQLSNDERVTAAIPVSPLSFSSTSGGDQGEGAGGDGRCYFTMVTRYGRIKRMELAELTSVRPSGIIAISLEKDDFLGWVKLTQGGQDVIIVTEQGQAVRFNEDEVRVMGRAAGGVNAVKLGDGDAVASMDIVAPDGELLVVTARGYGKRTTLDEYPAKSRYTGGVRTLGGSLEQTGPIAAARVIFPDDEIMLITTSGIALRTPAENVPQSGRATRGARVISLAENDRVASVTRIETNGRQQSARAENGGALVAVQTALLAE